MRTHTNGFKTNIKNLGRQFNVRVVYGSTTLQNEQINNATLNYNGDILKSVMKVLKLDSNIDIPLNTQITFEFGLLVGNSYEYINYGTFIVDKSEKQENTNSYLLTCYDKMLYSMKPYEDLGITYPITIRNYISALCTKLGLQFQNASNTFVNYNKQIPNELYLDEQGNSLDYNYRDVLDELAQVTASTICINDSGKLEIRYITNTNDTIDEEFLKNVNVNFGEQYGAINTITFSRSADSDSISKSIPENLPDADKIEIKISDNQILNGNNRDEFIDGILNQLYGLSYYVNDFSSTGITYYDLCDRYNITVGENTYSCVMLNDEININNGLVENIFTNMPETSKTDYSKVDKTDRKVNQTYLIVDKQQGQINAVVSQVEDIEQDLQNPTSTKEGEYFDLEDALDSPLIDFSLYGETQQDSTTGKNIVSSYKKSGTTYVEYYIDNTKLTSSMTFSFIPNVSTTNAHLYIKNSNGSHIYDKGTFNVVANQRNVVSFTLTQEEITNLQASTSIIQVYRASAGWTNPTFNETQLESGSTATSWEKYTGGSPAPNPSYPFDIHNVSGDNTIEICGKNLINSIETHNGINSSGEIAQYNSYLGITEYIKIQPNTIYTISFEHDDKTRNLYLGYKTQEGVFIERINNGNLRTFTTPSNAYYMFAYVYNSNNWGTIGGYIQLEKGSTATTYEPYTGNSQLISLGVENLFEIKTPDYTRQNAWSGYGGAGVTVNTDGYSFSERYCAMGFAFNNLEEGEKYTISFDGTTNANTTIGVGVNVYNGSSASNQSSQNVSLTTTKQRFSFTFTAIDTNIIAFNSGSSSSTTDVTFSNIQLEKGSKANSYSPYGTTPIELNKISTYQDYIYKDNDRWFLHKEIGKVVLDGTNNIFATKSGSTKNIMYSSSPINNIKKPSSGTVISNLLSTHNISKAPNTLYSNNTLGTGINTDGSICCAFGLSSSLTTKELANQWLENNNIIFYYPLATPTDTEITDATLLEQLNNLMTLPLYKNLTHITLTPNDLQPTMKIEYFRDTSINENFVSKEDMTKYYTKKETDAQILINSSSIQQSVSELQETTNGNTGAITSLSNQVNTLQTSTSLQINAINEQLEDGVSKVKTTTGYTLDGNGLSITKGQGFSSLTTDRYQKIEYNNKELSFMGYDDTLNKPISRIEELEARKITTGVHRTETIKEDGEKWTAQYYVGGGN